MLCRAGGVPKGCPRDVWEGQKKGEQRVRLLSVLYFTLSCWPLAVVCIGLLCNISFAGKKKRLKIIS